MQPVSICKEVCFLLFLPLLMLKTIITSSNISKTSTKSLKLIPSTIEVQNALMYILI